MRESNIMKIVQKALLMVGIAFALGFSWSVAEAGNCAPGFPVCWFSAECSTCCLGNDCDSYWCGYKSGTQCYYCGDCPLPGGG